MFRGGYIMTWVAVGTAGVGGVAALGGGAMSYMGARKGSKDANKAASLMLARMKKSANEIEGKANQFISFMEDLDKNFDPYNMEQAFNSLYEAVIMPMERDFDESTLPAIRASYSGSLGTSGAAMEAEANARRGLAQDKAGLRFQERGKAISRNYSEFDRRSQVASQKLQAGIMAPKMRIGIASSAYEAKMNAISTRTAADVGLGNAISGFGSSMTGAGIGSLLSPRGASANNTDFQQVDDNLSYMDPNNMSNR
jgi:hypothetical protein